MPRIFEKDGYVFFFYSNDHRPIHVHVRYGGGEAIFNVEDNVELRKVGTPPVFEFEPLDHIDIGTRQGWLDIEAGARLAGSRNFVLLGDMALLERAIMCFCMDHMLAKGFELQSHIATE